QLCMLDKQITVGDMTYTIKDEPEKMIALIKNYNPFSQTIYSQFTGIEMLLYGKQLKTNLANYYLILNTPLEPVESYIDFIMNQYLYLAMIVIVISLILAFFLAKNISQPIIKMKNEANKLAQGDYDAKFETNSFSEINDLASTLDDATEKLSKINDLRKDLIANVSHDIKTPLTMIKAYAEMIKDISGEDPKKRNEHLDVIIQESEYLDKLVSDMSELSKLQSGVIEINRDNFDMKECVGRVVVLLSKAAEEKNVQLIVNCDDCVAYADEIKISQVIYNFLSNALKYSDDNAIIIINVFDSENAIRVEVVDNGNGISKEALPYIWDRYYKVDKNFNRSVNSTGLGLAIAKAILEAHKARYGVESTVNEGSTFWFELSKDYEEE
nr:HAMP domain-containing histidine kinase [Erysipelotrichaceae bacterium]